MSESGTERERLFSDEDWQTFERAVETWGIDAQREMAEEEAAEFIVASKHVERGREDLDAVVEELADLRIMQEQLTEFVGRERVESRTREKMERLRERLRDAETTDNASTDSQQDGVTDA